MKRRVQKLMVLVVVLTIGLGIDAANAGNDNLIARVPPDVGSLVAWYEFEGDANDSSGNELHGTVSGAEWASPGWDGTGYCLDFDGAATDRVSVGTFDVFGGGITIACWFNARNLDTPGEDPRMVSKATGGAADLHWWMVSSSRIPPPKRLRFRLKTNDGAGTAELKASAGGTIELNVWIHVAATWDGSTMRIYKNAVEVGSLAKGGTTVATDPTVPVAFGNQPVDTGDRPFDGLIDEVVIFNHALSEEEITLLYRQGAAAFTDSRLVKLSSIVREAKATAKELKPQEAIPFIESKIAEFERWTGKNPNHVGLHYRRLRSDLYFLLAKAKEAAGLPNRDIAAAYKHATLSYKDGGRALTWLFENVHADEYKSSIKAAIQKLHDGTYIYVNITKQLESTGNWPAFELLLDTVFGEAENPIAVAKSVENGLRANSTWGQKYLEYCRGKPQLKDYMAERLRKVAEAYMAKEDFKKAGETYGDIIKLYAPGQQGSTLELKVCECLFNDGNYQSAISKLDRFLARNKASNRSLSKQAILMKGRCYIQLGEINKATNEFFTLTVEYPETKQAPEASFFIGYCYMLQRKFEEAMEALNLVVKDHPESSYTSKARLCLLRIKSMTQ